MTVDSADWCLNVLKFDRVESTGSAFFRLSKQSDNSDVYINCQELNNDSFTSSLAKPVMIQN